MTSKVSDHWSNRLARHWSRHEWREQLICERIHELSQIISDIETPMWRNINNETIVFDPDVAIALEPGGNLHDVLGLLHTNFECIDDMWVKKVDPSYLEITCRLIERNLIKLRHTGRELGVISEGLLK
jgi:hypothetical protein